YQAHAGRGERAEALAGGALEGRLDRGVQQAILAEGVGDGPGEAAADGAFPVGDAIAQAGGRKPLSAFGSTLARRFPTDGRICTVGSLPIVPGAATDRAARAAGRLRPAGARFGLGAQGGGRVPQQAIVDALLARGTV